MSVTAQAADSESGAAQGRRRDHSLVPRLIAAILFLPCLVVITRRGDLPFLCLVDLIIFTGILEFYALLRQRGFQPSQRVGALCALALSWYAYFRAGMYANFLLALALLLLMTVELLRKSTEQAVVHISVTMFGVLYVGWLGSHFILLRELPRLAGMDYALGADFVLLAILLTWSSDTGAYVIGRRWGRTPLFPRVSPKKSREGALGGVAFSLIAGVVAQRTFANYLGLPMAVGLAVLAAIAGLAGDLVESLLKRGSEAKDSGDFIPGHGGSLDRFDSLLFSVPLIYYFHKFFVI
jgi:phosphatidate cytidylyltransferase